MTDFKDKSFFEKLEQANTSAKSKMEIFDNQQKEELEDFKKKLAAKRKPVCISAYAEYENLKKELFFWIKDEELLSKMKKLFCFDDDFKFSPREGFSYNSLLMSSANFYELFSDGYTKSCNPFIYNNFPEDKELIFTEKELETVNTVWEPLGLKILSHWLQFFIVKRDCLEDFLKKIDCPEKTPHGR